jgi:hypothetical protein
MMVVVFGSLFWLSSTSFLTTFKTTFNMVNRQGGTSFTKKTEAYQKMAEMLESGEIDPAEPPRVAYAKHPLFGEHSLANFRAQLNKYKVQNNLMVRKTKDDDSTYNNGLLFLTYSSSSG